MQLASTSSGHGRLFFPGQTWMNPSPSETPTFEENSNAPRGFSVPPVQAWDDRMKRGILESDVLVDSPKVLSVVEILTSSYGHPRNPTKTYDISSKLRQMIERQVR